MAVDWGIRKFNADPEKCYAEFIGLGDSVTPRELLDYAKNPETELHKCFDWNDTTAAEKWRIHQARQVCCSFVVRYETKEQEEITFRLVQHDREEMAYKPVTTTVRNQDAYARLLTNAKAELISFKNRYQKIVELQNVIDEIDLLIQE